MLDNKIITDSMLALARARTSFIERMLQEMPDGMALCVHPDEYDDHDLNANVMRVAFNAHYTSETQPCTVGGKREVYERV